jgi:hypothetical protein
MVILFNFKRRRYFGYTGLLVRMTQKKDFLKALSEIRSNTPLSLIDYGSKYVMQCWNCWSAAVRPAHGFSLSSFVMLVPFFKVL